jgi:hypothetical protein
VGGKNPNDLLGNSQRVSKELSSHEIPTKLSSTTLTALAGGWSGMDTLRGFPALEEGNVTVTIEHSNANERGRSIFLETDGQARFPSPRS